MNAELRVDAIRSKLDKHLNPEMLEVTDDSHKHAGHEGAKSGGGHFNVLIVSDAFVGKNKIKRHRLVYAALNDMMNSDIHALSIQCYTPEEI